MKISRSSDCSFNFKFNNIEVDLCYPLISCSLDNLAIRLDTEISYYKFNLNEYNHPTNSLLQFCNGIEYIFTFKILGLGFIFNYSIKDTELQDHLIAVLPFAFVVFSVVL